MDPALTVERHATSRVPTRIRNPDSSISRFLTPEQATAAAHGAEVDIVDSGPLGGAWTLDRVWERLGVGAAIRRAVVGRRLDGEAVERVVFALEDLWH